MTSIKTTKAWTVEGKDGFDSLRFNEEYPLGELGDHDVLIKIHAVSLNYRDPAMPLGLYPLPTKSSVIPGSDAAGVVLATGSSVTRFKVSSHVLTIFNPSHLSGSLTPTTVLDALGGLRNGMLREHAIVHEDALVSMPTGLSFLEACTLPCAAVTAWNTLYGLKPLLPGQTVLTQGTGGVSIFAVQFAKAAGATVIATTSSAEKAEVLKKLGADHVVNYREVKEWGQKVKELTADGLGVDHIVEVGGPGTLTQSLDAVRMDGVVSIIGFLAGGDNDQSAPSWLEILKRGVLVRGVLVGSRQQFEEMNRAIVANKIKPVVDKKVFKLHELKEAYTYLWDQKHFGKLCIEVD